MVKNNKNLCANYPASPITTIRRDVAKFLVWAGAVHPGTFITWQEVYQRSTGATKLLAANASEITMLRKKVAPIRKLLMKEYNNVGLVTDPELGMRITTSAADLANTQGRKAATRKHHADTFFKATFDGVDVRKIPNTPEFAVLKKWVSNNIMPAYKGLTTELIEKLLPPKRDTEEEE